MEKLLIREGHLKEGESVEPINFKSAVGQKWTQKICERIRNSRRISREVRDLPREERGGGERIFSSSLLWECAQRGLKNLSGVTMSKDGLAAGLDLRGFNFDGADLSDLSFEKCDLSGASFVDAELEWVYFSRSNVTGVDFSRIRIREKALDLNEGSIQLNETSALDAEKDCIAGVHTCSSAEIRYKYLFGDAEPFGRFGPNFIGHGIVITEEKQPIGVLKLHGEHSFLPFQTVRDATGNVLFWKGGLYALEKDFARSLMRKIGWTSLMEERGKMPWPVVDMAAAVESYRENTQESDARIGRRLLRFLVEPEMYEKLPEWRSRFTNGKEMTWTVY